MSNDLTLKNAKLLTEYEVCKCSLSGSAALRFAEMGFVAGAGVTVLKTAPPGDPLLVAVCGSRLCIRKCQAAYFTVREKK